MRLRLVMFLVIGPLIALACFFAADELQMQWDDYSLARETREKTLEETLGQHTCSRNAKGARLFRRLHRIERQELSTRAV